MTLGCVTVVLIVSAAGVRELSVSESVTDQSATLKTFLWFTALQLCQIVSVWFFLLYFHMERSWQTCSKELGKEAAWLSFLLVAHEVAEVNMLHYTVVHCCRSITHWIFNHPTRWYPNQAPAVLNIISLPNFANEAHVQCLHISASDSLSLLRTITTSQCLSAARLISQSFAGIRCRPGPLWWNTLLCH